MLDASKLTPGVIDGAARHAFSYGACGGLAIALHDALGWPLVAITDAHNVMDGRAGGGSAMHWGVQRPDGKFIDIDGAHDVNDLVERFHGEADDDEAAWGISTRADAVEWYVEAQGEPIPLSLAATFVDAVVALASEPAAPSP
ncbi:hypothetical protein [Bosea sp. RAC05]|uniref:hypothetical protein n=1 Tax=Bosea sp. RAC05 TaxID=1842539 RepID=UPI00083DE965|nr:hypothetical protein [Bosea sp. RAC05]AOG03210.1 hypothetical protein BSY19_4695 [Bosea sp. RAC05]